MDGVVDVQGVGELGVKGDAEESHVVRGVNVGAVDADVELVPVLVCVGGEEDGGRLVRVQEEVVGVSPKANVIQGGLCLRVELPFEWVGGDDGGVVRIVDDVCVCSVGGVDVGHVNIEESG